MAAVWMRLRAEARGRWRAMIGLALLLGVMAGAATAAAAGARRTETAYPRFLERYGSFDLDVSTGAHPRTEEILAIAARQPQVAATNRLSLYYGSVRAPSGKEARFPDVFFFAEHERDVEDAVKVVSGRLSDPNSADETMVNYAMADRLDIRPGNIVSIDIDSPQDDTHAARVESRVVGVFAAVGQFETVTGSGFPTTFLMTPAFNRRWHEYHPPGEDTLQVRLRRGEDDAAAYIGDLRRALEARGLGDGLDGDPIPAGVDTPGVQGLNRVPAVALWLLCAAIGVTTIAVFSQLLSREVRLGAADHAIVHALGMSRGNLMLVSLARSLAIILAGAVGSIGVAYLFSPLTPVGLARVAEPDPGFMLTPLTTGLGAVATVILTAAAALPALWSAARWATNPRPDRSGEGATLLARWLGRAPLGVSARSGLRLVVDPGRGERAVPVRTAVLGTTIAIGALGAALTFAVSLKHLIREPKLAGYTWDAGAIPAAFEPGSGPALVRQIEDSVRERIPKARLWRGTVFSTNSVDGIDVWAIASDGPASSIIDGRAPTAADETAVDPRTMRQLDKELGDEVEVAALTEHGVDSPTVPMRLVGLIAVPRIAFQGINPGQGMTLTPAGLSRVQPGADYAEAVYIDFPPGMDFEQGLSEFRNAAGGPDVVFAIVGRQQSATVGNIERLSSLPSVLAVIMGGLGIATLAHALATTIRRRRRDLAILKAIGFVGRQVRATVAWESTALVATALLVGIPVGIAAGRWSWRLFAGSLQVVPVPVVSATVVASVAAGAILVANVIAAFPARVAARTEPAIVLRTE